MQELPVMTVQLAVSLERMSHTERIIYYTVGGHNFHPKACTAVSQCSVFEIRLLIRPFVKLKEKKKKKHITIFCKWSQDLKNHFLLLVLRLFLEKTNQLLCNVGGGKLLFAGL